MLDVLVVYDVKAVFAEKPLHLFRPPAVFHRVGHEIDLSVAGRFVHRREAELYRMAGAGSDHVHDRVGKRVAEKSGSVVAFGQGRVTAVEEFVGNTYDGHSLAGIAEYFRGRQHQHVVVGVTRYGRLERRFERTAQIASEIHREVGQVFEHDRVVLRGQLADNLQFLLFEADPGRIVRVRIDDRRDISLFQKAFQLIAQRCSPIVENVELAVFDTQYFQLRFLDRESRVDEQHGILTGRALARDDERAERSRDRSGSRNTGFRRDVYVQEGLYEARGFAFELRNAFGGRVDGCDTGVERRFFGGDSYLVGAQARYALVHPDERDARALLQGRGQQHYLSDRGLCQVGDLQLVDDRFDQLSTEYAILHVFRFRFFTDVSA